MSFLSLSVCLFWVRPHSVTHCVLWPSSYFSLNVPQCLLPLQHLTFLKNSSISLLWSATCRIVSCSFSRHTCTHAQASGVNESHVRSLLRLPPPLCYSLSLSLPAVTHSHMEGIIVMTHSLTPVPGSSAERQKTQFAHDASACVCGWVCVYVQTIKGNMRQLLISHLVHLCGRGCCSVQTSEFLLVAFHVFVLLCGNVDSKYNFIMDPASYYCHAYAFCIWEIQICN